MRIFIPIRHGLLCYSTIIFFICFQIYSYEHDGNDYLIAYLHSNARLEYVNIPIYDEAPKEVPEGKILLSGISFCSISSDSKKILYQNASDLRLQIATIEVDEKDPSQLRLVNHKIPFELSSQIISPTLSNDGKKIAGGIIKNDICQLVVLNLENEHIDVYGNVPGRIVRGSWSPNDVFFAFYVQLPKRNLSERENYGMEVLDVRKGTSIRFPNSLSTRAGDIRDVGPFWSSNSHYVEFEGRYKPKQDSHGTLIADIEKQKIVDCPGGYWLRNQNLLYSDFDPLSSKLVFYSNPIGNAMSGNVSKKDKVIEIDIDGLDNIFLNLKTNALYYQNIKRETTRDYLDAKKKQKVAKWSARVSELWIISFLQK